METTMKTTLLLSALTAALLTVSTASFAHTFAKARSAHATHAWSRVAARIGIPANAFNSAVAPARFAAQRSGSAALPYDFQLSGRF
jgi:hypothetical protein